MFVGAAWLKSLAQKGSWPVEFSTRSPFLRGVKLIGVANVAFFNARSSLSPASQASFINTNKSPAGKVPDDIAFCTANPRDSRLIQ